MHAADPGTTPEQCLGVIPEYIYVNSEHSWVTPTTSHKKKKKKTERTEQFREKTHLAIKHEIGLQ